MSLPAISGIETPTSNPPKVAKAPPPAPQTWVNVKGGPPPPVAVPQVPRHDSPPATVATAATDPTKVIADPATMANVRYRALFAVNGKGRHVVEVPHTEDPAAQVKAAWAAIKKRFPGLPATDIRRIASQVELPAPPPVIYVRPGMSIRQLFVDGSETEATLEIGKTRFNGTPQRIILRHLRSKSVFSFDLREEVSNEITRFSAQQPVTHLVEALPKIIGNILKGAEGFSWLFRLKVS